MKRNLAKYVVLAAALVFTTTAVVKWLWFDLARCHSLDMAPALQLNDWAVVDKRQRRPTRGQLVLFARPQKPVLLLIRRVVGLPGETVRVTREVPSVDDRRADRKIAGEITLVHGNDRRKMRLIHESLGGANYQVLKDPGRRSVDHRKTVLDGAYFVMSDNRNHGTDSRTFGPVPTGSIRGVVTHRMIAGPGNVISGKINPPRLDPTGPHLPPADRNKNG